MCDVGLDGSFALRRPLLVRTRMAFMLTAGESNDLDQDSLRFRSMPVDLSDLVKAGGELFACQRHGGDWCCQMRVHLCCFLRAAFC